jgi:outer membrane protein assembly factor BamD
MLLGSVQAGRSAWSRLAIRAAALLCLAAPLGACSLWGDEDDTYKPQAIDPADLLYNQGLAAMKGGDYTKAAKRFDQLDREYPMTDWSKKAVLMNAYANYKGGQYDDAASAAQRYVSLYPQSPDAAYAAYIYASSNYAMIPDVTRDQERTLKALGAFDEIVKRWPTSEYAEDAKFKAQVARDQLAGKEMEVGRFYMKQGNYPGAVNRFKVVLAQFQQTREIEEALSRLAECYMALGVPTEAQTATAILGHNYPNSQWYKDAYTLVKSNGLEPREDEGSWISKTFRNVITM